MSYRPPLNIEFIDHAYIKVMCDDNGFLKSLADYFTFDVPNAKFMPQYRRGGWDGKVRLFDWRKKKLYAGLLPYVEKFCTDRKVLTSISEVDSDFLTLPPVEPASIEEWLGYQSLPFKPKYYQTYGLHYASQNPRAVIISPTGSGKSFLMYLMSEYFDVKTLIVVPTINLVAQMYKDFLSYGWAGGIHKIMAGQPKVSDSQIFVSTWQSIYKEPKTFFNQFGMIMIDECHLATSQSLKGIMTKATEVKLRYGLSGTIQDAKTNRLELEGLFGKIKRLTTSKQLMNEGTLAELDIKTVILTYPVDQSMVVKDYNYKEEIDFLCRNQNRTNFIRNLALDQEGITLVLFQFVENHGELLLKSIKEKNEEKTIFYVHGGVAAEDREAVRLICERNENAIIVASMGTFSTGINIPKIKSVIFAHPTKSKIRTLQSIGRGLRKAKGKIDVTLFDIVDDLRYKKKKNYTYNHFEQRLAFYTAEQFKTTIARIPIS